MGEKERVAYWFKVLQTLVPNPVVVLVGTHLDSAEQLCLDTEQIEKEMSDSFCIPRDRTVLVSCRTGKNLDKLAKLFAKLGLELPMVGKPFPRMYLSLKLKMDEEAIKRNPPILTFAELKELGRTCYIVGEEQLQRATQFLHAIGYCFHFPKDQVWSIFALIMTPI